MTQDDADAIWAEHGEIIQIINHVAHLCILQLPAAGQRRLLTARQAEVLELVADGKTMQDIAIVLERNVATVENTCAARAMRSAWKPRRRRCARPRSSTRSSASTGPAAAETRRPHLAGTVSDNR
jgi:LuxR family transcriptional regulator